MASDTASGVNVKAIVAILVGLGVIGVGAFVATRDGGVPRDEAAVSEEAVSEDVVAEDAAEGDSEEVAAAPATTEADAAEPAPEVSTAEVMPPPDPPRFDQIRIAPDGSTVIAGRAPSGAEVSLRIDGEEVGTARSSGAGDFAAILRISPSDQPRIMSLMAIVPDGTEVTGEDTAIIAPFGRAATDEPQAPAPAEIAEDATPETEPDTTEMAAAEATDTAPSAPSGDGAGRADTADDDTVAADGTDAPPAGETMAEVAPDTTVPDTTDTSEAETPATDRTVAESATEPASPETPEVAATPPEVPGRAAAPPVAPGGAEVAEAPPEASETPEAPAIVIASPEGVRVVQDAGAPPEALTEVQIDAITYTTDGDVALSGRGPSDSQVQILLNNRLVELGEIGPGGQWSLELPDVDPGTYTLTVAQLSPDGEIESRVDTPFLREDPARVAASPMRVGAGVSVITVQPGFTLWGIAEANFGQGIAYVQIFEENRDRIRDPDWIFPGQIFRLPELPREQTVD
jgi:nucleoid-associated protein YgaU